MAGNAIAEGLNDLVHELIAGAIRRAKENGRKTVRPHDF
jgi:histone H3/H4